MIPNTVETIGFGVLANCRSLSTVILEEGTCIRKICNIEVDWTDPHALVIPKNVDTVQFDFCAGMKVLESVSFEEGSTVKKLDTSAFAGSGLKSFHVPKTVTKFSSECFAYCESLSEVTRLDEENRLTPVIATELLDLSELGEEDDNSENNSDVDDNAAGSQKTSKCCLLL